jgi:hypothetical protein
MSCKEFEKQNLTVKNSRFEVALNYEQWSSIDRELDKMSFDQLIVLGETNQLASSLVVKVQDKESNEINTCLIKGLDGGCYLHTASDTDSSQSVKLDEEDLILSIGFTLLSFNLSTMQVNWAIRPDRAELFEFYDLEDDILVRGELEIHRVDKKGNILWSYGGRDIWVNIDGQKEIEINKDTLKLIDFESNEYWIDLNGKTLKDNPKGLR